MDTFFASSTSINGKDDSLYFLMARFPILAGESAPLDRSIISFASLFLAKRNNDHWLAREGLEIYNTALNALACALQQKSSPTLKMLYATIALHTFEVSHFIKYAAYGSNMWSRLCMAPMPLCEIVSFMYKEPPPL